MKDKNHLFLVFHLELNILYLSYIYIYRKDKYKDINELLNDKSEIKKVANIYSKYSLVMDDYDDEYDDTYDSHDVRGTTQDDVSDSRAFTTPRVSSHII